MSESTTDVGSRPGLPRAETRCPACGQPLARLVRGRCPLCDYPVEDEPVTGEDRTPYAQSGQYGRRAWWAMCKWIWGAGAGRLAHLALMQSSAASRRFGRVNAALVVLTVAVCWLWLSGWHAVRVLPGTEDGEARPNLPCVGCGSTSRGAPNHTGGNRRPPAAARQPSPHPGYGVRVCSATPSSSRPSSSTGT